MVLGGALRIARRHTGAALGAAVVLEGGVEVEPDGVVRVSGKAGAASETLGELAVSGMIIPMTHVGEDGDGVLHGTEAVGLEGLEVEDVDTLGLTEELESLDTGGLLLAGHVSMMSSHKSLIRGYRAAPNV